MPNCPTFDRLFAFCQGDFKSMICLRAMNSEELQTLHELGLPLYKQASVYMGLENFVKKPSKE